jgi:type I restriction enzyme S subunit
LIGGVNRGEVNGMNIPLPPISEQRLIAHVLTTVRQSIEATERVIAVARELKHSLMKYLFTYGPVPIDQADQVVLKETEVGMVPEEWEIRRLQEILSEPLRNGHSAQVSSSEDGIRTLTLTVVTKRDFSIGNTKITNAFPNRVKEMWLKPGDIFIERANTPDYVGLVALYDGVENFAIYPDLLIRIRVDRNRANPKYIEEFLLSPVCRRYYKMRAKKTAGNFPKIDQLIVENTTITLPSLLEQSKISTVIYSIDAKIKVEEGRKIALNFLFDSLLHHLMTGKVRVPMLEPTANDLRQFS